ncbi:hypothetical protein ADK49_07030 [Streptomyces sp. WM6349]|nr:hypothetical protein ADK49_07030 [Streptomyces sp. WM6349]
MPTITIPATDHHGLAGRLGEPARQELGQRRGGGVVEDGGRRQRDPGDLDDPTPQLQPGQRVHAEGLERRVLVDGFRARQAENGGDRGPYELADGTQPVGRR